MNVSKCFSNGRVPAFGLRLVIGVMALTLAATIRADTLVSWDLPTSTATTAPVFGTAASGLTVSAIGVDDTVSMTSLTLPPLYVLPGDSDRSTLEGW